MQQTGKKRIQDKAWLGWKVKPLRIVQEIKIWPYWLMVYAQTRISPRKWNSKNSLGQWDCCLDIILLENQINDSFFKLLNTDFAHGFHRNYFPGSVSWHVI